MGLAKKLAFSALAAGLVLGGLAVTAEFAARGAELEQANPHFDAAQARSPDGCHEPSLTLGWAPTPGACGRDARGLLGEAVPLERTPGVPRVLVIGDSVAAQDAWVGEIREGIRRARGGAEVLNAGVSGYGTCQELETLRQRLPVERPDLVVLQTCPNDLVGSPVLATLPDGTRRYFSGDGAFYELPGWIFGSALLSWGWMRYGPGLLAPSGSGDLDEGAQAMGCLAAIQSTARGAGVPILAVGFPVFGAGAPSEAPLRAAEDRIRAELEALGFEALDLRPEMERLARGEDLGRLQSSPGDVYHPNVRAQRAAGRAIGAAILERGLLPD